MDNVKYTSTKCGLLTLYRSKDIPLFRKEIYCYWLCPFLQPDEWDQFCGEQQVIVLATLPDDSAKVLAVMKQLDYHARIWRGQKKDNINWYERDCDFTNNLMEIFNRVFGAKYGKKLNFFQFLSGVQEVLALSALTFRKMELYKEDNNIYGQEYESIFNKSTKVQREAKQMMITLKRKYESV
eukprot:129219_1